MRTAFVTGGTGFLGLNLVDTLIRDGGYRVIAIHRPNSNLRFLSRLGAELRVSGIDDAQRLTEVMPEGVDAVFHVAGDVSWWTGHRERQRRANVDGTRNVVEAALQRRAKCFIHTSSTAAYGLGHDLIREDTKSTAPQCGIGYFETKWEGEQVVRQGIARGLHAMIMNPSNILGPYDTTSWGRIFGQIKANKLPGLPPGSGSFCHARAVVAAHLAAVANGRVGENYLLGGTDASYVELGALVAECLGKRPPRALPAPLVRAFGHFNDLLSMLTQKEADLTAQSARVVCSHFRCDASKAIKELGFRPAPLRDMVNDSYQWLLKEGLI
jgi:nucleoside-diphosphate-sugar epimerase